jgi:anti-sigma B factor antagonist
MSDGSHPRPLLSVSVERTDGFARIRLAGELDLTGKARFEEALHVAEALGPTAIFLDVENLVFMDSTGLSALLGAIERATPARRGLQIRGARERIRRILVISGLHWLLDGDAPAASETSAGLLKWEPVPMDGGGRSG